MVSLPDKYNWMEMNPELETALDLILNTTEHLNIIGPAGVGKSCLLRLICDDEVLKGRKVVLSSTGIAAVNASSEGIKGSTVHSFFRFAPLTIYSSSMLRIQEELYEVMNNIDILIIDEVSMLNSSIFDFIIETLIHYRSKQYKNIPRIILFGDILQLPPVIDEKDETIKKYFNEVYNGNYMYFNSNSFFDYGFKTVHLNTIYRQKDTGFQSILNRIRQGTQTSDDLKTLNQYVIDEGDFFDKKEMYLYITTTNKKVNEINDINLEVADGKPFYYKGIVTGNFDLKSKPMLQEFITLKEGVQIMCIRNDPLGSYQNGTLGRVKTCHPDKVTIELPKGGYTIVDRVDWEEYDYSYDSESGAIDAFTTGKFNQIALKQASALSVWKTQGQTIDNAYVDLGHWTPAGVAYVALSRLRNLDGLGLKKPLKNTDIKVSKEALEFLTKI